jgi:hypothetical protein
MRLILAAGFAAFVLAAHVPLSAHAATSKPTMSSEDKAARSKDCSAQANAKGLHGKERKAFRSKCKRGTST